MLDQEFKIGTQIVVSNQRGDRIATVERSDNTNADALGMRGVIRWADNGKTCYLSRNAEVRKWSPAIASHLVDA